MKKREADFGTYFRHWLKSHPMYSGAFELKQTTGKSLPFPDVQEHQIEALQAASSRHGILYKAPDDSRGIKPFDYFYLRNAPAWVVIKFPDAFHIISISNFVEEKEKSILQRESYTFENFWNDYGKKQDNAKCRTAWNYLTIAEKISIKDHVPRYVASTPEVKYRKNPLTYLHGKCWNDEILPPKGESSANTTTTIPQQPKIRNKHDEQHLEFLRKAGLVVNG